MVPIRWFTRSTLTLALVAVALPSLADDPPTFADRPDEDVRDADRAFGFLLNPLAIAVGIFGGEADFVLGRYAAVAVEGDLYRRGALAAAALGAGLLLYPQGSALHRLYLEPRFVYARPLSDGIARIDWSTEAVGVGATAGWQWTWDYGFSVRLGGGAMYFLGGPRGAPLDNPVALGPELVVDGSFGWVF
jgi:hypothetical protein